MSAETNNDSSTYEEQLSDLESRLEGHQNDEALLAELGRAMRQLLSRNGDSEAHIREILERQFDQGNLRPESYELVQELLTRVASESGAESEPPAETESGADEESTDYVDTIAEEPYVQTMVIEQPGQDPVPVQAPPAPARQLQIGSVLRDRYLLKEQVAEGSAGTVFKALDRRSAEAGNDEPFVAIKVVSPQLAQNPTALNAIQQEAAKSRCLSHPNIAQFIDFDRDDDVHFVVMEWIDGRSLAAMLDDNRGNALDFDMATNIAGQVSRALSYAHQRGVVHADLKPGNIIITADGMVKLIDFGAARIRQKVIESKSRFDPDVVQAGTPPYSSMQVLTGEDPVAADDVFSLACLLYRLVAGHRLAHRGRAGC